MCDYADATGCMDCASGCVDEGPAKKYKCWELYTVRAIKGADGTAGFIPVLVLPESLIGKTVKVTIQEQA